MGKSTRATGRAVVLPQPDRSLALLQESETLLRQAEARNDLAFTLYRLWFVTWDDAWAVRVARLEESLALYRQLANPWGMGQVLGVLGESYIEEESGKEATTYCARRCATNRKASRSSRSSMVCMASPKPG